MLSQIRAQLHRNRIGANYCTHIDAYLGTAHCAHVHSVPAEEPPVHRSTGSGFVFSSIVIHLQKCVDSHVSIVIGLVALAAACNLLSYNPYGTVTGRVDVPVHILGIHTLKGFPG